VHARPSRNGPDPAGPEGARAALEAVWRIESARIIGALTRMVGDVDRAEDFAQEALVAALERWPESGVPDNPGAWLMTAAKRRAIDHLRRAGRLEGKHAELARELEGERKAGADPAAGLGDPVGDDVLRLVFLCCHPMLSAEARVALTLRLAGGLTTREIARAFLVPESTLAQRIVRAKRTLREARVPFAAPDDGELARRLSSVLEVVYLIFNEGYAATSGDDWFRPRLCHEAIRLGRILAELAPDEPEVHGLVSLMEIQASRLPARLGPSGEPVLLLEQDRGRWDRLLIRRGLAALDRAVTLGVPLGPYTLQAAVAACHARARSADETDWERIAALYDALAELAPSPVVELNRAVAVGMAFGPEAGLALLEETASEGTLDAYPHLPAVRGHLLERLGRLDEAREAFEAAAERTANAAEARVLKERARRCGEAGTS
jgi:RNA polymerase sigma-70 factor, ECF subfamily